MDQSQHQGDRPPESLRVPPGFPEDPSFTFNPRKRQHLPLSEARPAAPTPVESIKGEPFIFRRVLGVGGFGEVWEALQSSLGRVVAVKRLRLDRMEGVAPETTAEEQRLFEREARTGALLDHPGIVPVYDLGSDEEGHPLIAMKLVAGRSWNELLKAEFADSPPEQFLAKHLPILASVAQAVAFAHDRGIIHRDLKPAQVIVGDYGEVLLIDWGLAVVWNPSLLPSGLDVRPGRISTLESAGNPAGTPAYMAPEQTEETTENLGPWTDVYLLGGMLYQLLAGLAPHYDVSAPMALYRASQGLVTPAAEAAPGRASPPELVALAMEALDPEPRSRIASAKQFVNRLEDYLSGDSRRRESLRISQSAMQRLTGSADDYQVLAEVVSDLARARMIWPGNDEAARGGEAALERYGRAALKAGDLALARAQAERLAPGAPRLALLGEIESAAERVAARERQRRTALAAVMILLVGLALLGVWANGQRIRARQQEILARERAEEALAAQRQAEENLEIARHQGEGAFNLIGFVLKELRSSMEKELGAGRGITLPVATEVSHAIAGAVASPVVEYFEELDTTGWPREMQLEHAGRMLETGARFEELGRYAEGERLTSPTLRLREQILGADSPDVAAALVQLGVIYQAAGRYADARTAFERALEIQTSTLGERDPATITTMSYFGSLHMAEGDYDGAEPMFVKALALAEEIHGPDAEAVATILNDLANLYRVSSRFDQSEAHYRRALEIRGKVYGPDSTKAAQLLNNLGNVLRAKGKLAEAEDYYKRGLEIRERECGPEHPETAQSLNNVAGIYKATGRYAEAEPIYLRTADVHGRLVGPEHPSTIVVLNNLAGLYELMDRSDEAEALYRRVVELREKVLGPDHQDLGTAINNLASVLESAGKFDEAIPLFDRALAIRQKQFGTEHPKTATVLNNLAHCRKAMGDLAEAERLYKRALEIREKGLGPDAREVAASLMNLAAVYSDQKRFADAESMLLRSITITGKLNGVDSGESVPSRTNLARLYFDMERYADSEATFQSLLQQRDAADPKQARAVAGIYEYLGRIRLVESDKDGARVLFQKGLEVLQTGVPADDPAIIRFRQQIQEME